MKSSDFTHMKAFSLVVLLIYSIRNQKPIPQISHKPVVNFATFQPELFRQHIGIVALVAYRYAFLILDFSEEPCVYSVAGFL
jgi:hypothetical protein